MKHPPEPCPFCGKPMTVTGEDVVVGGVNVGTTWRCDDPKCGGRAFLRGANRAIRRAMR